MKKEQLELLKQLAGDNNYLTDPSECIAYSYDNSRFQGTPLAVIFGRSTDQISKLIKFCHDEKIIIYCRGKGSATTGASVPTSPGIVLSLEKMNQIKTLDVENRVMVVEPGVTNEAVQIAANQKGFFWAPDPSSASTCTIGGNLACNAAGPRAVKYGSTRDNVLGLTAVTGAGEIINTGVYTTKGVVGFDLTRLLIGSEGSLAVITQANLKLLPLAEAKTTLRAIYTNLNECTKAIAAIMNQGIIPCALEFIDEAAINTITDYTRVDIPKQAKALLMIEVEGLQSELPQLAQKIIDTAKNPGLLEINAAKSKQEVEELWKMRKALSPALKKVAPKKINEDVVVPVSNLPEFIAFTHDLMNDYSIKIVNFGHSGNGNIHVNILLDPADSTQAKDAEICLEKIFDKVLALKGTLSGEHGIGMDKRDYILKELDPNALKLMHQIKAIFDPANIMNPDKVLPNLG